MDSAKIETFENEDVYLIQEGGQDYISFGSPSNHHYWLVALNRILEERPDYKFQVRISEENSIEVDMQKFAPTLQRINNLIQIIR